MLSSIRLFVAALLACSLWSGCAGDDDDSDSTQPEQALVAESDWALAADPGWNDQPRGRLNWFVRSQPLTQQQIHPGWPHNENIRVLEVVHQPFAFLAGSVIHYNAASWTSLASRPALDTLGTVLEWKMLFAQLPNAGVLLVDIGQFSEDLVPNGVLDSEDANNDGTLQESEDIGLDELALPDCPWPIPVERVAWTGSPEQMETAWGSAHDWQDVNGDYIRDGNEPWSWDDWSAADEDDPLAGNPSGTEGNNQDADHATPDTEDLDGDLSLDTADNFLRYSFPLDPAQPTRDAAITQLNDSDWLQLSLQLEREHQTMGTPDLEQPVRVRLTFTGFNGPVILYLTWFDWR